MKVNINGVKKGNDIIKIEIGNHMIDFETKNDGAFFIYLSDIKKITIED